MNPKDLSVAQVHDDFEQQLDDFIKLYGLELDTETNLDNMHTIKIKQVDGNAIEISTDGWENDGLNTEDLNRQFDNLFDACIFVDELFNRLNQEIFSSVTLCNPYDTKSVVQAAITTRDLAKNLVRVKSSNVWAYSINIRDRHNKVGDVLTQFKGPKGGPGDIYLYYDVPVNLWRRWLAAPSKGHFFWQHIRNVFSYRKLTGDKRGKLRNAIN